MLLISALASLFVTGTNLVPMQSYATVDTNGDNEITKDYKDSIHKDVNAGSHSTNRHSSQENLCYRDDDCEQANDVQQIVGKDNEAKGFNDQSKKTQSTPATTGAAGGTGNTGNGTTPIPPTPTPTVNFTNISKKEEALSFLDIKENQSFKDSLFLLSRLHEKS